MRPGILLLRRRINLESQGRITVYTKANEAQFQRHLNSTCALLPAHHFSVVERWSERHVFRPIPFQLPFLPRTSTTHVVVPEAPHHPTAMQYQCILYRKHHDVPMIASTTEEYSATNGNPSTFLEVEGAWMSEKSPKFGCQSQTSPRPLFMPGSATQHNRSKHFEVCVVNNLLTLFSHDRQYIICQHEPVYGVGARRWPGQA
jgi:hypothetical protein